MYHITKLSKILEYKVRGFIFTMFIKLFPLTAHTIIFETINTTTMIYTYMYTVISKLDMAFRTS